MEVSYSTEAYGTCICGYSTWTTVNDIPLHPCCADNGPNCEPCRISRAANKRRQVKGTS